MYWRSDVKYSDSDQQPTSFKVGLFSSKIEVIGIKGRKTMLRTAIKRLLNSSGINSLGFTISPHHHKQNTVCKNAG